MEEEKKTDLSICKLGKKKKSRKEEVGEGMAKHLKSDTRWALDQLKKKEKKFQGRRRKKT